MKLELKLHPTKVDITRKLPQDITVEDINKILQQYWEMGKEVTTILWTKEQRESFHSNLDVNPVGDTGTPFGTIKMIEVER